MCNNILFNSYGLGKKLFKSGMVFKLAVPSIIVFLIKIITSGFIKSAFKFKKWLFFTRTILYASSTASLSTIDTNEVVFCFGRSFVIHSDTRITDLENMKILEKEWKWVGLELTLIIPMMYHTWVLVRCCTEYLRWFCVMRDSRFPLSKTSLKVLRSLT